MHFLSCQRYIRTWRVSSVCLDAIVLRLYSSNYYVRYTDRYKVSTTTVIVYTLGEASIEYCEHSACGVRAAPHQQLQPGAGEQQL